MAEKGLIPQVTYSLYEEQTNVPTSHGADSALPSTSQMDYRALVHERDEAAYGELRAMVLDLRAFYVSVE